MQDAEVTERRNGPSTSQLSLGGVVAVVGLIFSGVAVYNSVQNDISSLKISGVYQSRTDDRQDEQMKINRMEFNQGLREINTKLDAMIERMPSVKR